MIIRKLRIQRGWSQDQLAQISGLNIRTIQRIERGQTPSLESLKSLASVFETQNHNLQPETVMPIEQNISMEEARIIEYVRDLRGFYSHTFTYVIIISGLLIFNFMTSPDIWWAQWPAFGWGIGLLSHGLAVFEVFNLFGPDWEKKSKKGWVKSFEVMRGVIKILPIKNLTQWKKEQQSNGVIPNNTVVHRNGQHHPRTQ
jgi:transcriptional regulator with XRE-family HTH domain